MRKVFGMAGRTARLPGSVLCAALAFAALPLPPARAQFFWSQPRLSPDDVARAVVDRGFRPTRQPFRNDQVYVADVIDRRGRQERLIVSADSGEILQRFFVEGDRARRFADPTIPPGPLPPGRIPGNDQPGLFSRLFGDHDDPVPQDQPSQFGPNYALPAPVRPRPKRVPRVVERSPDTVTPLAPVTSAPLAPPVSAAPAPPPAAPTTASVPPAQPAPAAVQPVAPASAPPVPDRPGHPIARDPLAIPGSKEDDAKTGQPTAFAVSRPAAKPAVAAPAPDAAPSKPPASKSVPVAPLD